MKALYTASILLLSAALAFAAPAPSRIRATSLAEAGGKLWMSVEYDGMTPQSRLGLAQAADASSKWKEHVFSIPACASDGILWTAPDGSLCYFYALREGVRSCTYSSVYTDKFLDGNPGTAKTWMTQCRRPEASKPVWEAPVPVGEGIPTSAPAVLPDGSWRLPLSGNPGRLYVPESSLSLAASQDAGRHWSQAPVRIPLEAGVEGSLRDARLFVRAEGTLVLTARSSGRLFAYRAQSRDGGASWFRFDRLILNPDRCFSLDPINGDRILLVKNNRYDRALYSRPEGVFAYLSDDAGDSWYGGLCITPEHWYTDPVTAIGRSAVHVAATRYHRGDNDIILKSFPLKDVEAAWGKDGLEGAPAVTVLRCPGARKAYADMTAPYDAKRSKAGKDTLRIGTYNIQNPGGGRKFGWPWPKRIPGVLGLLKEYRFDVVGTQEPYENQIEDIIAGLDGAYDWVGSLTGDHSPSSGNPINPIFFRKERVRCLDHGTLWYTEVPNTSGFGASSPRMAVWARFQDLKSGKEFYCFNSHYDHISEEAMVLSSDLLIDAILRVAKGAPAFLTGDFNCRENSAPYQVLLSEAPFLADAMTALPEDRRENWEYYSMCYYKPPRLKTHLHLDHIFYTPGTSRILSWKLITDSYEGSWGSDHMPIIAEWVLSD